MWFSSSTSVESEEDLGGHEVFHRQVADRSAETYLPNFDQRHFSKYDQPRPFFKSLALSTSLRIDLKKGLGLFIMTDGFIEFLIQFIEPCIISAWCGMACDQSSHIQSFDLYVQAVICAWMPHLLSVSLGTRALCCSELSTCCCFLASAAYTGPCQDLQSFDTIIFDPARQIPCVPSVDTGFSKLLSLCDNFTSAFYQPQPAVSVFSLAGDLVNMALKRQARRTSIKPAFCCSRRLAFV